MAHPTPLHSTSPITDAIRAHILALTLCGFREFDGTSDAAEANRNALRSLRLSIEVLLFQIGDAAKYDGAPVEDRDLVAITDGLADDIEASINLHASNLLEAEGNRFGFQGMAAWHGGARSLGGW